MEIKQMVMESLEEMEKSGKIKEIINSRVGRTVTSIADDLLKDWSDFGKALKTKLKESLKISFDELTIPEYNELILNQIQGVFNSHINELGIKQIKENVEKLLSSDIPKEIKLSEIIEKFKEEVIKYAYEPIEERDISFHCEGPKYSTQMYHISFDKEENKNEYECKYRLSISDNKLASVHNKDFDYEKHPMIGSIYGFERLMFQLYCNGSRIIVDNVDTYLRGEEY